jgi:hypothetical protein
MSSYISVGSDFGTDESELLLDLRELESRRREAASDAAFEALLKEQERSPEQFVNAKPAVAGSDKNLMLWGGAALVVGFLLLRKKG